MNRLPVHNGHHHTLRTLVALIVVVLAFGIFAIIYNYSDDIAQSGNANLLFTLAVVAAGFLIGLVYLVNQGHHQTVRVAKASSSRKTKSKKRR